LVQPRYLKIVRLGKQRWGFTVKPSGVREVGGADHVRRGDIANPS
jgi:hypothetical protein